MLKARVQDDPKGQGRGFNFFRLKVFKILIVFIVFLDVKQSLIGIGIISKDPNSGLYTIADKGNYCVANLIELHGP